MHILQITFKKKCFWSNVWVSSLSSLRIQMKHGCNESMVGEKERKHFVNYYCYSFLVLQLVIKTIYQGNVIPLFMIGNPG